MNWVAIGFLLIGFLLGVTVLRSLGPFALRFGLKVHFWVRHGRKGRVILFVYSDSSNWKDHIEAKILPRLKACSVILNWSNVVNGNLQCNLRRGFSISGQDQVSSLLQPFCFRSWEG